MLRRRWGRRRRSTRLRWFANNINGSIKTWSAIRRQATSSVRFGPGVAREVGMDFQSLKAKHVAVFTDKNVSDDYYDVLCINYDMN